MWGCLSHNPHQGPGPQPRHVPRLGIKPVTLCFTGWCSIHWTTPARAAILNRMSRVDLSEVSTHTWRFTGNEEVSHLQMWGITIAEGEMPSGKILVKARICLQCDWAEWVKERMIEDDIGEIMWTETEPCRAKVGHNKVLILNEVRHCKELGVAGWYDWFDLTFTLKG